MRYSVEGPWVHRLSVRRAIILCGLPALLSALQIRAQEQSVFRVGTRLVEVDVVVRNKNGPVTGLTKDDFTVFDCREAERDSRDPLGLTTSCKGKRQPIQVFRAAAGVFRAAGGTTSPQPSTATSALPPGAVSNRANGSGEPVTSATVLLLDQLNTSFDHKEYERSQAVKFLQSLQQNDRVAVYSLGKDLHLLQDFTDDPRKLVQAVTNLDSGLDLFPVYRGDPSIGGGGGGFGSGAFVGMYDGITLDAVKKIAQHLSGVPGRKNLVWIKETPQVALRFEDQREILTLLREANIAVYPVMVRSLKSSGVFTMRATRPAPPGMPDLGIQKAARDLGASLGGTGFADAADIAVAVRTAEQDSASAYTLGFYPAESDLDGTLHQLTVAVSRRAAAKGALELHYRTEYLATPKAPPNRTSLADVFESPLNATNIGLTAVAAPDHVNLTVNLADVQLKKQDDRWVGSLRLATRLEVNNGGVITAATPVLATVSIRLTDQELRDRLPTGLVLPLPIPPGDRTGSLRIVIQDATNGAAGSLRVSLGGK